MDDGSSASRIQRGLTEIKRVLTRSALFRALYPHLYAEVPISNPTRPSCASRELPRGKNAEEREHTSEQRYAVFVHGWWGHVRGVLRVSGVRLRLMWREVDGP